MRDPVWVQQGLDALKETLDADAATKQQMIDYLLDEGFWDRSRLTEAAARTKFNACMNPGKPDFFKLSELWALMKRFHRYQLLFAMCEDMGFERPVQIPAHQRRADLQQRLRDLDDQHAAQRAAIEGQLAQLSHEEPRDPPRSGGVLRIHPANREPGPAFDLPERDGSTGPGAF